MGRLGLNIGLQRFRKGANVNQIPQKAEALFWLDGVIVTEGENKYFRDKTTNDRKFLITDYDFDSTWIAGFPYKSAATISAPAADAALLLLILIITYMIRVEIQTKFQLFHCFKMLIMNIKFSQGITHRWLMQAELKQTSRGFWIWLCIIQ